MGTGWESFKESCAEGWNEGEIKKAERKTAAKQASKEWERKRKVAKEASWRVRDAGVNPKERSDRATASDRRLPTRPTASATRASPTTGASGKGWFGKNWKRVALVIFVAYCFWAIAADPFGFSKSNSSQPSVSSASADDASNYFAENYSGTSWYDLVNSFSVDGDTLIVETAIFGDDEGQSFASPICVAAGSFLGDSDLSDYEVRDQAGDALC